MPPQDAPTRHYGKDRNFFDGKCGDERIVIPSPSLLSRVNSARNLLKKASFAGLKWLYTKYYMLNTLP